MSLTPKIRLGLCCDLHPLLSELDHLSSQCSHLSSKRTCQPSLPGQRGARWDGSIPPPRAAGVPASPGVCPRGSVRAVRAGKQAAPLPGFQMDCGRVCRRRASSRDGPPPVLQVTRVSLFRPLPLRTALVRFVTAGRRCRPGTRSVLRGFPCASRAGAQSAEYFYGRCASAWSAVFSYLFTSYSWRSGVSIAELHETANEGGVCAVF